MSQAILENKYLILDAAGTEFAIDLAQVEECVPASSICPLKGLPDYILGIAFVRGKVLTVIDPAIRFNLGMGLRKYFLVCKVRERLMAIAIDQPITVSQGKFISSNSPINSELSAEFKAAIKNQLQPIVDNALAAEPEASGPVIIELNPDELVINKDFICAAAG